MDSIYINTGLAVSTKKLKREKTSDIIFEGPESGVPFALPKRPESGIDRKKLEEIIEQIRRRLITEQE